MGRRGLGSAGLLLAEKDRSRLDPRVASIVLALGGRTLALGGRR